MRQNFEPKIWGNHAWFFLETICMAYPTNPSKSMKSSAKNFFLSLKDLIPCEKCRNNYILHLKKYPLTDKTLSSRDNLFVWIVNIHNSVDPKKTHSYDDTFKYYLEKYNYKNTSNSKKFTKKKKLLILFLIILIILLIYQISFLSSK